MALVKTKPTSAGRRSMVKVVNADLHKGAPHAPLVEATASPNMTLTTVAAMTSSRSMGGHSSRGRNVRRPPGYRWRLLVSSPRYVTVSSSWIWTSNESVS